VPRFKLHPSGRQQHPVGRPPFAAPRRRALRAAEQHAAPTAVRPWWLATANRRADHPPGTVSLHPARRPTRLARSVHNPWRARARPSSSAPSGSKARSASTHAAAGVIMGASCQLVV